MDEKDAAIAIKTIVVGLMTVEDAKRLVPAAGAVANAYGANLISVHPVEGNLPHVSEDGMNCLQMAG